MQPNPQYSTPEKLRPYPCEGGGFLMTNLELLPRCTLKKMTSADGLWEFDDTKTHIGKEYIYSPASRQTTAIKHVPTDTIRDSEIVLVYDERGFFCMMPTECLNFPSP